MKIQLTVGEVSMTATLKESDLAKAIYGALPFDSLYSTWGDEIYFNTKVQSALDDSQVIMDVGDLAYWPVTGAFCLFYGPTPASTDERPCAASDVAVFGKIDGDATQFKEVSAPTIHVEKVD